MTDFFIKGVPLPLPRPLMEETITGGSITSRMPLGSPEKPVDAFSGGGSYPTSGETLKSLYEAVTAFKHYIDKLGENMNFSTYSGYGDKAVESFNYTPWVTVGVIFAGTVVVWYGLKYLCQYMGWKW